MVSSSFDFRHLTRHIEMEQLQEDNYTHKNICDNS
jgi:hypothetical protein